MLRGSGETLSMEPADETTVGNANYDRVRREGSLWRAWASVRENGLTGSPETRAEIVRFEKQIRKNIRRIGDQLRSRRFSFGKANGVQLRRPGKSPRPIVIAPVESRIVQRAILDELQSLPELKAIFEAPHSFGCLPNRNRGDAIVAVLGAFRGGAKYFLRSDIREFYTAIPRRDALAVICGALDAATAQLLEDATIVELANAAVVDRNLFPTEERGVAQGHCLSPLLANVLLREFDDAMNQRNIQCFRYVDDFLILGPTEQGVRKAFESAQRLLEKLGLSAYDPKTDDTKAECGSVHRGFDFLGCKVQPGLVRPSRKSTQRILGRCRDILMRAGRHLGNPAEAHRHRASLQRVLYDLSNVLRGWRDSFDFCKVSSVFNDLDAKVDEEWAEFMRRFRVAHSAASPAERRLLLGLPVLGEHGPRPGGLAMADALSHA